MLNQQLGILTPDPEEPNQPKSLTPPPTNFNNTPQSSARQVSPLRVATRIVPVNCMQKPVAVSHSGQQTPSPEPLFSPVWGASAQRQILITSARGTPTPPPRLSVPSPFGTTLPAPTPVRMTSGRPVSRSPMRGTRQTSVPPVSPGLVGLGPMTAMTGSISSSRSDYQANGAPPPVIASYQPPERRSTPSPGSSAMLPISPAATSMRWQLDRDPVVLSTESGVMRLSSTQNPATFAAGYATPPVGQLDSPLTSSVLSPMQTTPDGPATQLGDADYVSPPRLVTRLG